MPAIATTEGDTLIANLLFKNADVNRGTGLKLGLFTNSSVSASTTYGALTQPTGGGYAEISLTDGSWSVASGVASYAAQTFTVSGTTYSAAIYGYYIRTMGTSPKIITLQTDPAGPITFAIGDTYVITPNITLS